MALVPRSRSERQARAIGDPHDKSCRARRLDLMLNSFLPQIVGEPVVQPVTLRRLTVASRAVEVHVEPAIPQRPPAPVTPAVR